MALRIVLLSVLLATVLAEPEPEAQSQYRPKGYQRSHHDTYAPKYPTYSEPSYPKPKYHQPAYKGSSYYCDPKAPPKCAQNATLGFCLKDYEYPEYDVQTAIEADPHFAKKYAEVAQQSADDLVDGVSRHQEESFDYSLYNGNPFDKGNWVGVEGYLCPSKVLYARPVRAVNAEGEWRVIVQNVNYYTQTQRVEKCLYPGAPCRALAPCYRSRCAQKYVYHRMLAFDPCDPYKGVFIDIFKLPSACSCHLPQH